MPCIWLPSINDSEYLAKNHFSVIKHHQAISSYLDKGKQLGVIMGPISNFQPHILLTLMNQA